MSKPPSKAARAVMRAFLRFEKWRFRRSNGTSLGPGKHPQLLLTTVGRKTGKERTVALFYHQMDDRLVVIASFAGSDTHPAWWLNLRDNGKATVEIGGDSYDVTPTVLEGDERERAWQAMVEFWPSYDTYVTKTDRKIPVVALTRA